MVNTYTILFKKNNTRVTPGRVSATDARIFQLHLQRFAKGFADSRTDILNNISLLIAIDGYEYYRQRRTLKEKGILTVADIIEEYGLENITHVLYNGILLDDRSSLLDDIYVLELFSPGMYHSTNIGMK
jgi:predicted nuclease of restriction endonuclease-like RecB superfamily